MNEKLEVGNEVYIQSYKHDGSLHRTWCKGIVVEATDTEYVVVTNKTWVIESDGRRWLTREPAVCFFWTNRWYNVISMIRKTGVYYYCNLASPSLYDGEAIKNIDYDLDVKLFPDWSYMILDENEYADHARKMNYPQDIKMIVESEMQKLLREMEEAHDPFNSVLVNDYYSKYRQLVKSEN